jgi:hypothetical protein
VAAITGTAPSEAPEADGGGVAMGPRSRAGTNTGASRAGTLAACTLGIEDGAAADDDAAPEEDG